MFSSCRYHDMPDVIDFLVLRQSYDEALRRNWQPSKSLCTLLDASSNRPWLFLRHFHEKPLEATHTFHLWTAEWCKNKIPKISLGTSWQESFLDGLIFEHDLITCDDYLNWWFLALWDQNQLWWIKLYLWVALWRHGFLLLPSLIDSILPLQMTGFVLWSMMPGGSAPSSVRSRTSPNTPTVSSSASKSGEKQHIVFSRDTVELPAINVVPRTCCSPSQILNNSALNKLGLTTSGLSAYICSVLKVHLIL